MSKLISMNEPYKVRDWTKGLDVTKEVLQRAIAAVGTSADQVREHLKSGK